MKNKNGLPALRVVVNHALPASMLRQLAKSADDYIAACLGGASTSPESTTKALEQYYTDEQVARDMLKFLERHIDVSYHLMVEPSAGAAAFLKLLPSGSLSFDVDPRCAGIIKANFLALTIDHSGPVAVIGNPPFSAAVAFFNHAASQADVIAMILPRTFNKDSVRRRLDRAFHLIAEMDVPAHAFLRAGEPYDVPAVFQIWEKRDALRPIAPRRMTHPDFRFGKSKSAHFAIQRVGANAGRIHREFGRSGEAHLFVTAIDRRQAAYVEGIMAGLPLAGMAKNTAGNPSIAASEIVALYTEAANARWCRPIAIAPRFHDLTCRYVRTKQASIKRSAA